jgi:hypothetical protein
MGRYSDKNTLLERQFALLKQRVCLVCGLKQRDRLKACSNCQIMHLVDEIKRRIPDLEKFKECGEKCLKRKRK